MSYFFALLAGPQPSGSSSRDRLPLRAPEQLATGWALAWEQADGALVLPGDRLCVFRAPDSGVSITATPPVPGQLRITVPDSEWLAAGSSVGELRYGPALETALKRQEAAQRTAEQDDARAQGERRAELARLQDQEERLARERDTLHSKLQALARESVVAPLPETETAAAELGRFAALIETPVGLADCDPIARLLGLLRWEEELHAALRASGLAPAPALSSRAGLVVRAERALAELYRRYIDVGERNTHDFPDDIQLERLQFWRRLRERHRDRIRRDGPLGRTADPAREGKS